MTFSMGGKCRVFLVVWKYLLAADKNMFLQRESCICQRFAWILPSLLGIVIYS